MDKDIENEEIDDAVLPYEYKGKLKIGDSIENVILIHLKTKKETTLFDYIEDQLKIKGLEEENTPILILGFLF